MTLALLQAATTSLESDVVVALREGRDDDLVALMKRGPESVGFPAEALLAVLRQTSSSRVRNIAALAIVDFRPPGGEAALAEVLERRDVAKEAGTLVYALDEIGGSLPLPAFMVLIEHGSYEARAEAILLMENDRVVGSTDNDYAVARARLHILAAAPTHALAEAASEALNRLPTGRSGAL